MYLYVSLPYFQVSKNALFMPSTTVFSFFPRGSFEANQYLTVPDGRVWRNVHESYFTHLYFFNYIARVRE